LHQMSGDLPTTSQHRGPVKPQNPRQRPALVCAFPRPFAIALPGAGMTLGRAVLAGQGLVDSEVSNEHLRIEPSNGGFLIADAESRNGTWVNSTLLAPGDRTPLDEGAVVRMGRTLFVFREHLRGSLEPSSAVDGRVGAFGLREVEQALGDLRRAAPDTVLIEGETGVGKELVAHAVAAALGRAAPFAAVNVAGIASGVFESQMFGHVAGAFSDARKSAPGIIVAHQGGTVFLDEIGELDLDSQAKLLRLLENREVMPVGASRSSDVDVLIVAATNRDLDELAQQGRFRRDLLARLCKTRIAVPALRDRSEDLFELAAALSQRDGVPLPADAVEVEAMERLMLQEWPSNVRELDAVLAAVRRVDPEPGLRLWALQEVVGAGVTRSALTTEVVEAAVAAADGNLAAAARSLGISRGRLLRFRKRSQA
jgi:transcriptional regulator of acetoin/glycerol metabolism